MGEAIHNFIHEFYCAVCPYLFVISALLGLILKFVFLGLFGKRIQIHLDKIGVDVCFLGITFGIASGFSPVSTFRNWFESNPTVIPIPELFFTTLVIALVLITFSVISILAYKAYFRVQGAVRIIWLTCSIASGAISLVVGSILVLPVLK